MSKLPTPEEVVAHMRIFIYHIDQDTGLADAQLNYDPKRLAEVIAADRARVEQATAEKIAEWIRSIEVGTEMLKVGHAILASDLESGAWRGGKT